jgi:hypothetical protein
VPPIRLSFVVQMLLYVAWHAVIGVFLGLGVFATVVLGLVALHLFA